MKRGSISAGLIVTLCLAGGIIISQNSTTEKVQEKGIILIRMEIM